MWWWFCIATVTGVLLHKIYRKLTKHLSIVMKEMKRSSLQSILTAFKVVQSTANKWNFQINYSIVKIYSTIYLRLWPPFENNVACAIVCSWSIILVFGAAHSHTMHKSHGKREHVLAINLAFKTKIFWKLLQHLRYWCCMDLGTARAHSSRKMQNFKLVIWKFAITIEYRCAHNAVSPSTEYNQCYSHMTSWAPHCVSLLYLLFLLLLLLELIDQTTQFSIKSCRIIPKKRRVKITFSFQLKFNFNIDDYFVCVCVAN